MAKERIKLLGVPIDICPPEELEFEIMELLAKPGTKQIVFITVWDLLKARGKSIYAETVRNADLVLPLSQSIIKGARFLKFSVPYRENPFDTLINIFSILDAHYKTLYILGGHKKSLLITEQNMRLTFPNCRLLGKFIGYYPKTMEKQIIQAIYKASPSLVLLSEGIKEKDAWAYKRRNSFSSSIFIYYKNAIGILSDTKKRIDKRQFEHGTEIFAEIFHNPLKFFLIFPYIRFIILLIWEKLKKR